MYTYPDKNDMLTIELINGVSGGTYWEESEKRILEIAVLAAEKTGGKFLDAGCGLGRLFAVFAPYVKSITALEPDAQRCQEALKSAAEISCIPVTVINGDSSRLTDGDKFDIVLSSHVLQHISENIAKNMIRDMAEDNRY